MPGGPCALHNLHNLLLRHWNEEAILVPQRIATGLATAFQVSRRLSCCLLFSNHASLSFLLVQLSFKILKVTVDVAVSVSPALCNKVKNYNDSLQSFIQRSKRSGFCPSELSKSLPEKRTADRYRKL